MLTNRIALAAGMGATLLMIGCADSSNAGLDPVRATNADAPMSHIGGLRIPGQTGPMTGSQAAPSAATGMRQSVPGGNAGLATDSEAAMPNVGGFSRPSSQGAKASSP